MKTVDHIFGVKSYHFNIKPFKAVTKTAGNGHWSRDIRKIIHSRAELCLWDDQLDDYVNRNLPIKFGEMRVYFPKKNWDVTKHGLIYTDPQWIKDFRASLVSLGFSANSVRNVDYTEQGMQGDNYVSLDVDNAFIKQALKLNTKDFRKLCKELANNHG